MMKYINRALAVILAAVMTASAFPVTAFAKTEGTKKEEVVYVNLNMDGSVKEIHVVNIFDLDSEKTVTDYGDYESVKNMNTLDIIEQSGNQITIEAGKGKLYYEGTMQTTQMPWKIDIAYFMDGKEYEASELAGKSGQLKIIMHISKNQNVSGTFFDGCALQASFTLDTNTCKNIVADGAVIVNVGSDKQLTYTILPSKGADMEILTDVTDFEMAEISINGVRLNLNLDIDESKIQEKMGDVIDAAGTFDEGAGELKDGIEELSDGTNSLVKGVGKLHSGVNALSKGTRELYQGLSQITKQSDTLIKGAYTAYEGLCDAVEAALNTELEKNGLSTINLTPKNYKKVLNDLLSRMDADAVYQQAYHEALKEVTAQVEVQAESLYEEYINSQENAIYISYLQSQAQTLYNQVAAQAVLEQLTGRFMETGLTKEEAQVEAQNYIQTAEGQVLIAQAAETMTEEQKKQILATAVSQLTDEERAKIKEGALASLTKEQQKQIREAYIDQMMAKEEVTDKIAAAVSSVSEAAKTVAQIKGQLDSFGAFCEGVKTYTQAVDDAAKGAKALKINMDKLYKNTGVLKTSVGKLDKGVKALYDGTSEMKDGTEEFVEKTDGIDEELSAEIDSMISEMTGKKEKTESFVSEKNKNVTSVQFVIKTESIEIPEEEEPVEEEKETTGFVEKLKKLFQ